MSKKVPFRNRNHTGWWIFCEVEQWISDRHKKLTPRSRCVVWQNTRLLKARTREEAYRKAMKFAMIGDGARTNGGYWRTLGISELLPVYEEIEDGAEILWEEIESITMAKAKALVKKKRQLSVFNDAKKKA